MSAGVSCGILRRVCEPTGEGSSHTPAGTTTPCDSAATACLAAFSPPLTTRDIVIYFWHKPNTRLMKESSEGPAGVSVSVPPEAAWDGWRGCQVPLQGHEQTQLGWAAPKHRFVPLRPPGRCGSGHAVPARQAAGSSALHGERAQPGAGPSLQDPRRALGSGRRVCCPLRGHTDPAGGFAAHSEDTRIRPEGLMPGPTLSHGLSPAGSALRTHRAGLTSPAGRRGCGRTWHGRTARSSSTG